MLSPILTLALLPTASHAFAPSDAVWQGIEPQRTWTVYEAEQARARRGAAWQRFVSGDGAGWQVRFDEATGTPRYLWGRGLPMPAGDEAKLVDALERLLDDHHDLLGFEPGTLALRSASYVPRVDTWYVEWSAPRDGTDVYRGGISARVKHGNLVMLAVATRPDAPVTGEWTVSADDAVAIAISAGPAPTATHGERSATGTLLERQGRHGLELRRTWQVRSRTFDPPGKWVSFVDAETGELLDVYNEVRFITGTVSGQHHARTVDGSPLVTSPMPLVAVAGAVDADIADESGTFDVTASATYTTDLDGDYLRVSNAAGPDGLLVSSSPDLTWTSAQATQAEIDSYVFLHQIRDWALRIAPEVGMSTQPLVSIVNQGQVCNAYYDGNVNFFAAGGGCNNTGQIADVNYHEWGHGFHYYSIEAGIFDGSLSEGASDVVSFLQTQDRYMAPWFLTNGGAIRDVEPDRVYPEDFVNNPYYVHDNGLIFGGAMWDLMGLMQDRYGETAGTDTTAQILAGLLKGGSDIPGTFFEAMVADDDDGDLGNGTPNLCELYDAFGRHGLGTAAGESVLLADHEPLVTTPADQPIPIEVSLVEAAAGCVSADVRDATVHYRVDGGAWKQVPLSAVGDLVTGDLPGQPLGTIVDYYVDGESTDGTRFAVPWGTSVNPYTVYVGDTLEVHCDDFEADDGGWTHELVDGVDQEGADDWQWGAPIGASGDPNRAFSGNNVWGNDLGYDNFNGAYQPEKTNRLSSPRIDTGAYTDVFLQYRRWLQIEDATYDRATIRIGNQEVWSNWQGPGGDDHHLDTAWVSHSVDLGGRADQAKVKIAFELASDGGVEFGGWTVDDVCLMAPATADNRLAITDLVVEPADDALAHLAWTQPLHQPVEQVVVVRRTDRFPDGHDDGQVVWDDPAPVAGAAVELDDPNGFPGTTYYAVYGFDGQEWLSWTVEGWNAGQVELVGAAPGDGVGDDGGGTGEHPSYGGCGCAGTGAAPVAGWGLALGMLLARRRRS